jgi:NADH-quinone oxidoreductase subunit M
MFFWGLMSLASFGFPGTNGFVGEFLVIAAAFGATTEIRGVSVPLLGLLTAPGAMLAAAYALKVTLKLAWGQPSSAKDKGWPDLNLREWVYLLLPAVFVIYLGLAPGGVLSAIEPSITATVETFQSSAAASGSGDWLFRFSSSGLAN